MIFNIKIHVPHTCLSIHVLINIEISVINCIYVKVFNFFSSDDSVYLLHIGAVVFTGNLSFVLKILQQNFDF